MRLIKPALRTAIELIVVLAILLAAAIAPGLLSASSSTIVLPSHHSRQTETTP